MSTAATDADVADRIESNVRDYILGRLPPDASGELAAKPFRELLHIYGRWRARIPAPRPRSVHQSREMLASAKAQEHAADIAELIRAIEAGEDLKPRLSRAVETAFLSSREQAALPRRRQEDDRDRMLADWGIHHLHLSNDLESDGFVKRGGDLVYALLRRESAYVIGVYTHADWALEDVVRVAVGNWPRLNDLGSWHKLSYVTGTTYTPTEEQRRRDRRLGISGSILQIDGVMWGRPAWRRNPVRGCQPRNEAR